MCKELENWKHNNVYDEVPFEDQHLISTRWALTTKEKEGSLVTKARLVARGFEDDSERTDVDSPTCSKETFKIALSVMAMKGWQCQALDVKTAFLQGSRLKREVFLKPPKEAKTQMVWRLQKAVYGLREASRCWYERVKEELGLLDFRCSKYDEALFYSKVNGKILDGINSVHVDDILFAGSNDFLKRKMSKIRNVFERASFG